MIFATLFHFFQFIFIIYFWLHWVFVGAHGLSLVAVNGGFSPLQCAGISLWWLLLIWGTDWRHVGSVVAAHRSRYSKPCEIFPDQGSNWCPLRRQAKSHPLCHQGKAICFIFKSSFQFTAKLKGRYRISPYTSCSHTCIASLVINIPTRVIYLL